MAFTEQTANNYKIVGKFENDNHTHIIMKRDKDYAIGYYYDVKDGTWGNGVYGYKTVGDALSDLTAHIAGHWA